MNILYSFGHKATQHTLEDVSMLTAAQHASIIIIKFARLEIVNCTILYVTVRRFSPLGSIFSDRRTVRYVVSVK
jgi:hypothetical protein